jgi:hypothetical protein
MRTILLVTLLIDPALCAQETATKGELNVCQVLSEFAVRAKTVITRLALAQ